MAFDIKELAAELSISTATAKNWQRLGKLKPDAEAGLYSADYVSALKKELLSAQSSKLKSRRNKSRLSGSGLYRKYIDTERNRVAAENIIKSGLIRSEKQLRLLLGEYALCLYSLAAGMEAPPLDLFLQNQCGSPLFPFIYDITGEFDAEIYAGIRPALVESLEYQPFEDTLGFFYISLCDFAKRKQNGIYYTPFSSVSKLISELGDSADLGDVLDPCCGSGSFLIFLAKAGLSLSRLFGQDNDPLCIAIARFNLYLAYPASDFAEIASHITLGDSLLSSFNRRFDTVLGNPPWGNTIPEALLNSYRSLYKSAKRKKPDICDIFIEAALSLLKPCGRLAFILPQALLNTASHRLIRREILSRCSFSFADYIGNVFPSVHCPAVILGLCLSSPGSLIGCRVSTVQRSFTIHSPRNFSSVFSFDVTDDEEAILTEMENDPSAVYLKGNAVFALGIVTGNNSAYLSSIPLPGYEPIVKGSDITPFGIKPPSSFIRFEPQSFQQSAPEALYRSPEKLFYRFIGEKPVFALDTEGRLSLNSCNILIPKIPGFTVVQVLNMLNSAETAFYISKRFASLKLLRSHLESVPLFLILNDS